MRHDNTLARPYISYGQADRVDIILTNPPFGGKEEDGIESNFPAHFRTKETADLFLALFIRLLKPGGRAAVVLPDGTLFGEGVKTRLKEQLMEECCPRRRETGRKGPVSNWTPELAPTEKEKYAFSECYFALTCCLIGSRFGAPLDVPRYPEEHRSRATQRSKIQDLQFA